jgi:membrane protein YdbS with pleckstrin-like domain
MKILGTAFAYLAVIVEIVIAFTHAQVWWVIIPFILLACGLTLYIIPVVRENRNYKKSIQKP